MNYNVKWNGGNKTVLTAAVNEPCYNTYVPCEYVLFSSESGGVLTVYSEKEITSAKIRPLSLDLTPDIIDAHTIEIKLDKPMKFSLEVNDSYKGCLLVLASKPRELPDTALFENIIHFEAGVHTVNELVIDKSNTLIIADEGAVVNGGLRIMNADNVTVCGHGIFTKQEYDYIYPYDDMPYGQHLIYATDCKNLNVLDTSFIDSIRWTLKVVNCDNVYIDNINIIGCRGNSDGIDVSSSRDVLVERAFIRTWDDSFCVKALNVGDVRNLVFKDSTLWNDFARPIEIGVELQADVVDGIEFRNIDIIHSMTGYPLMGIHHGDHAVVSNVVMDDIRLEDIHGGQIFDIRITDSVWNFDSAKGGIENITIKNIAVVEEQDVIPTRSRLSGFDETASINNVTIENISFCGRYARSVEECQIEVFDHVNNLKFIAPSEDKPTLNRIATELKFKKEPELLPNGHYASVASVILENKGNARECGEFKLEVFPVNTAKFNADHIPFALDAGESAEYEFDVELMPGKNVIDIQSKNPSFEHSFMYVPLALHVTNDIAKAYPLTYANYYGDRVENIKIAVTDEYLILDIPTVATRCNLYTALPVEPVEGEVVFEVEETDFGEAPAITLHNGEPVLAPQLRCPAEIYYVFKNAPKTNIVKHELVNHYGVTRMPLSILGIPNGTKNFWLDIDLVMPMKEPRRYASTLFHSLKPEFSAHMYANIIVD